MERPRTKESSGGRGCIGTWAAIRALASCVVGAAAIGAAGCIPNAQPATEADAALLRGTERLALTVPFPQFADAVAARAPVLHARVRSKTEERIVLIEPDGVRIDIRRHETAAKVKATFPSHERASWRFRKTMRELRAIARQQPAAPQTVQPVELQPTPVAPEPAPQQPVNAPKK